MHGTFPRLTLGRYANRQLFKKLYTRWLGVNTSSNYLVYDLKFVYGILDEVFHSKCSADFLGGVSR